MKIVIGDAKTGASWQRELEKSQEAQLYGRRVGEAFDGGIVGLEGYSLKITGGSDRDGTPMRGEIKGPARTKALLSEPPGVRSLRKGEKRRKLVRGNTVSADVVQINAVISNYGSKGLEELGFASKAKESPAAKPAAEAQEKKETKSESGGKG
jgi:small subunit ribosomal protein S6e